MSGSSTPSRQISGRGDLKSLEGQVGGHIGVMSSLDGSLIAKPCFPTEIDFYQAVLQHEDENVQELLEFIPTFLGTLKLEGKLQTSDNGTPAALEFDYSTSSSYNTNTAVLVKGVEAASEDESKDMYASLILENIASTFKRPNIIDIKLGTILYADDASPEKRQRMIERAKTTTSLETGIRLTGFQLYDHTKGEVAITSKPYGRSLKPSDLPEAIRRVFPVSNLNEEETPSGLGLPRSLLVPILSGIIDDLRALRDVLSKIESRMVGSSLLIVYEADWKKARQSLDRLEEDIEHDTDESKHVTDLENESEDEEDTDSDEQEDSLPYVVKLIDFAHSRLTPGQGPDHNVLKGVETTINLFVDRLKELED